MIVAVGIDSIEIERIASLWRRMGDRFLTRLFLPAESGYCLRAGQPAASLAARFCAKEAVMKCLRTGWTGGVAFRQIEVTREPGGAVAVHLHDAAAAIAGRLRIRRLHLSLSHNDLMATAFAVAED